MKLQQIKQTWKEKPLDWKFWVIGMIVGIPPWGMIVGIEALKVPLLIFQASGIVISVAGIVLQHKRHKREREALRAQLQEQYAPVRDRARAAGLNVPDNYWELK